MTDISKDAKCSHTSFAGFGFGRKVCGKSAKMEHDGKFYCGIHDPVRIKDKRKAQADKWRAEADAERAARAAKDAKQAALEQDAARYRWLLDNGPDVFTSAYYNTSTPEAVGAAIDAAMKA